MSHRRIAVFKQAAEKDSYADCPERVEGCSQPISCQRTGVRLRLSIFARLASEIFLSSLPDLLIPVEATRISKREWLGSWRLFGKGQEEIGALDRFRVNVQEHASAHRSSRVLPLDFLKWPAKQVSR
jgi:hypothetical protein